MLKTVLWVVGILAVVLGGLRLTALRWWQVPSDDDELAASIAPTLHPGDWVILWRLTPLSFGDLVVCPDPDNEGYNVIGRVGGEGGDSLRLTGGDIYVNRKKMATESACNPPRVKIEDPAGGSVELPCSIEAMGGIKHMRLGSKKSAEFSTEVPAGSVFLVSDNRNMPFDSRNYGTLQRDACKETVVFRIIGAGGFGDVESRFMFIQ